MCRIAHNYTLRVTLSFTVCASLLLLPSVSLLSEASPQAVRTARPGPKKPQGMLPDLEEMKNESHVEREAPPPIPSTMRSPKLSEKPWDGRRVGDPETTLRRLDQAIVINKEIRRAHARKRLGPVSPSMSMYEDTFIQNFFNMALLRGATYDETLYWNYQLRAAYNQGQTSLKLAAVELGKTVFESASYAARNRDAHWYVYDLYKTYLMRDPDAGGWAYWESQVGPNGSENVRRGFEESGAASSKTGATPFDVYYGSTGIDEYVILHETLHILLGLKDKDLTARGADLQSLARAGCNSLGDPF